MKKSLSLLVTAPFIILVLLPGLLEGAITVKSPGGGEIRLYRDYHALVVGVGDYDVWPDLPGAVRDAEEVGRSLKAMGMTVTILLNPPSDELKDALDRLVYGPAREKDRAILLYFSGHGETETLANGEKLGYIVPKDAPLPSRDHIGFVNKAVSMNQLETYALRIQSKHVLMVFDSCFSGSVFSSVRSAPTDISEKSARDVRQFITAGNEDEQVPDESVFRRCFVEGIQGEADFNRDGYVTASELGMYLDSSVVNYSKGSQHPQYGKIRDPRLDKGDFIFTLAGGAAEVSEPAGDRVREKAYLSVETNISGARVLLDGGEIGSTPLKNRETKPGKHRLRVEKEGYEAYEKSVILEKGRSLTRTVALSPEKPRKSRLFVDAEPGDARIRILNIEPRYERGMELDAGRYQLEVSTSGYVTRTEWLDLAAGEDRYVDITLAKAWKPEPPFVSGGVAGGASFTNDMSMTFLLLSPGSFTLGSPLYESGRTDYEFPHPVTISKAFYLQSTEVTVGQWRAFAAATGYRTEAERNGGTWFLDGGQWNRRPGFYWDNPGYFQTDLQPVTCLSWNDGQAFIQWLNRREGTAKYRLPTEAEWEYACRAGSVTSRYWGEDLFASCRFANMADQSARRVFPGWAVVECDDGQAWTAPAGSYGPNGFGLFDMIGNAWEWCRDWCAPYPTFAQTDPRGPSSGTYRILRGGSWESMPASARSASRLCLAPDMNNNGSGFRVARDP